MFAGAQALRFVPVVSNPHVAFGGVLLERLCTALRRARRGTLVVDAAEARQRGRRDGADRPRAVHRAAVAAGLLPRRARPADPLRRCTRARRARSSARCRSRAAGSTSCSSTPARSELCRLFARRTRCSTAPVPAALADDRPASVTHAYASMKLLAQRAGLRGATTCCSAPRRARRAPSASPTQLAACADTSSARCCATGCGSTRPATPREPPGAGLRRLVAASCACSDEPTAGDGMPRRTWRPRRPPHGRLPE